MRGFPGTPFRRHEWLYIANAALLFSHEVDAAYWHEWAVLRLPLGAQGFVVLHVVLFAVFLAGLAALVRGRRWGAWCSLALAAAGLFAAGLHGTMLASGHPAFRAPVSLSILALAGVVSVLQAGAALRALRR